MQNAIASTVTQDELVALFVVVAIGFIWFVRIARKRNVKEWRLKSFFLGGARIGPELTEHNTIGTTFAWSGGTWFFVSVAYHSGPWVILLQVPWVFSILLLAMLFERIVIATRDRTIHGYLATLYGNRVQRLAALATTVGYIVNTGFELFWASLMFSGIVGRPDLRLTIAILIAVVTALYCSIGGYISNAETDKPQNILGVIALAIVVMLIGTAVDTGPLLRSAVVVFGAGSALYAIVASALPYVRSLRSEDFQNRLAVAFAASACILSVVLWWAGGTAERSGGSPNLLQNLPLSTPLLVGLLAFQTFFNAIDMSNWQQIAANGDEPQEMHAAIRWSIVRGSLYLFWFPAVGGTLLGCLLRAVAPGVQDDAVLFTPAFNALWSGTHSIERGLLLGFLSLGFIATSLSTADTMLMSAVQTLTYDLVWIRDLRRVVRDHRAADEQRFVLRSRALLIPIAVLMVLVFWGLYLRYPGDVLNFQSLMYAWALTLFGPVLFGLFQPLAVSRRSANWIFGGMVVAISAVLLLLWIALNPRFLTWKDWSLNVMPIVSNGIMLLACIGGRLFGHAHASRAEPSNV